MVFGFIGIQIVSKKLNQTQKLFSDEKSSDDCSGCA
jgi:hypothetical protein